MRGRYPYAVSLQNPQTGHFCGGSLIAKDVVLSAAHCTLYIIVILILVFLLYIIFVYLVFKSSNVILSFFMNYVKQVPGGITTP